MKKTKLLMPILATAGLGCAIAPMITLVGCSTKIGMNYDETNKCYKSEAKIWKKGTYVITCNYESNKLSSTKLRIGLFNPETHDPCTGLIETNEITLEIAGNVKTLTREQSAEHFCYDEFTYGFTNTIKITYKNGSGTVSNTYFKIWTEVE